MSGSINTYQGQQDQYRGSSYPGFAGGSTNSSGDYVPAGTGINPQPPTSSPLPTTGLKSQQPSQLTNSLLQAAGPATSLALTGGKALYNNWSGIFGSATDPATGTALDASTAAATPSIADGSGGTGAADSLYAGDPILSGANAGTDSLGVANGVADGAATQSGGLLGTSVGGAGGGVASSAGTGAGATEAVGEGAADTGAEAVGADVGAGATDAVGADVGAAGADELGADATAEVGADAGIGDTLATIGEAVGAALSVVCTELFNQNRITLADYQLDVFYMNYFLTRAHYDGYISWAPFIVRQMRKPGLTGKIFTWGAYHVFTARQKDIKRELKLSKQGSAFGRTLRLIGEPICYFIGQVRQIHLTTNALSGD